MWNNIGGRDNENIQKDFLEMFFLSEQHFHQLKRKLRLFGVFVFQEERKKLEIQFDVSVCVFVSTVC